MSRQEIYSLLGEISVTFATIEHRLLNLLEYLLEGDNQSLARPYILDDLPISRCIEKIRSVGKLRLWDQEALHEELKTAINSIDSLRVKRNIFIHGLWSKDELKEQSTSVNIVNFKPRVDKETGVWEYLESVRITNVQLQEMLSEVNSALSSFMDVYGKIIDATIR